MFKKAACFFTGNHKYEVLTSFEGTAGDGISYIRTEKRCTRCGDTVVSVDVKANLATLLPKKEEANEKKPKSKKGQPGLTLAA